MEVTWMKLQDSLAACTSPPLCTPSCPEHWNPGEVTQGQNHNQQPWGQGQQCHQGCSLSPAVPQEQGSSTINHLTWHMGSCPSTALLLPKLQNLTLFGLRNEGWCWWGLVAHRRGAAHSTHSSLSHLLTQMNLSIPYQSRNVNPAHTKHWLIFYSNEHRVTFVLTTHQFR